MVAENHEFQRWYSISPNRYFQWFADIFTTSKRNLFDVLTLETYCKEIYTKYYNIWIIGYTCLAFLSLHMTKEYGHKFRHRLQILVWPRSINSLNHNIPILAFYGIVWLFHNFHHQRHVISLFVWYYCLRGWTIRIGLND